MTAFQDDPRAKVGATPSLLALLRDLHKRAQPPLDATAQLQAQIAREARLPASGGLIGSTYARYMAGDPQVQPEPQSGAQTSAVFGPMAAGIDIDQPEVDPAEAYQAAGPVSARSRGAAAQQPGAAGDDEMVRLRKLLEREEKPRLDVYRDTQGFLTVGIGHKVLPADDLKEHQVISQADMNRFFEQDGRASLRAAHDQASEAGISDPDFIQRLASVNFQLGNSWRAKFPNTWKLIMKGDYAGAADEVGRSSTPGVESDWLKQTPLRAEAFQGALRALANKRRAGR